MKLNFSESMQTNVIIFFYADVTDEKFWPASPFLTLSDKNEIQRIDFRTLFLRIYHYSIKFYHIWVILESFHD